ncbi:MAG: sensor histidine kinase [Nocardioidaceae bacterium]
MDSSTAALVGGAIGALLGIAAVLAWQLSERAHEPAQRGPEPAIPPGVSTVLSVLRSSALVVGPDDEVYKASAPAYVLGLVHGSTVADAGLLEMVRAVRRDGQIREGDLSYRRDGETVPLSVAARVAPLGSRLVLVLAEDRTRERRVEAIRRDFVANVSHELKTPVGAINVLAETVGAAAGDPDAVQHFSARMRTESERLTRLVQQVIELSRVQGDDPLEHSRAVPVDTVVEAAIDRVRVDAEEKELQTSVTGERGHTVVGDKEQLTLALGSLVENAVAYSTAGSQVRVSVRRSGATVGISVTDHGIGIPATEIDRIFERFYRVDPARARDTGGTGLGLSIVKHVVAIHGGEVAVSSVEGEGSTFTVSLPLVTDERHETPDRRTPPDLSAAGPRGAAPVSATQAPVRDEGER